MPDRTPRKKAPKPAAPPVQPAQRDPGGLTGRGQTNPALTDPGVMGVPGGVMGRQAPGSRMASPTRSEVSPSAYSDPGYPSFNQSYPSDWKPSRPRLDPDITHRGRSEPVRVRTKPLQHPSGGPINSFPWTTDHPLVQANLTKARFEEPKTSINAQDWPTYFNLDEIIAQNTLGPNAGPASTITRQKMNGIKEGSQPDTSPDLYGTQGDSVFDLGMTGGQTDLLQTPTGNVIVGGGEVDYGTSPGGIAAIAYQNLMLSLGNKNIQNYAVQQDMGSPFYQRPDPTIYPDVKEVISIEEQKFNFDPVGPTEVELALQRPVQALIVNSIRSNADAKADSLYHPESRQHDVFGHAYASYRIAKVLGAEVAKEWGDSNERNNNHRYESIFVDLHNNEFGRHLAGIPGMTDEIAQQAIENAIKLEIEGRESSVIFEVSPNISETIGKIKQPTLD